MKTKPLIFISYAREDAERVTQIYEKLVDMGFGAWLDRIDILPREIWPQKIKKALRESSFFLACLSRRSVGKRGFIQREIKAALDIWQEKLISDIYLIPLRLDDCVVPNELVDFQRVDLFSPDGFAQLSNALQIGLTRLGWEPTSTKIIENPVALFEDKLLEVALPIKSDDVYCLKVGDDDQNCRTFLYPFKQNILRYCSPSEIASNATLIPNAATQSLKVVLNLQGQGMEISRDYPLATNVIGNEDALFDEIAAWPDFTCKAWNRYFYFKCHITGPRLNTIVFEPLVKAVRRQKGMSTWYVAKEPAQVFSGKLDDTEGLLLLNLKDVAPPPKLWKVGIDLGTTHTRAFSLVVEKDGDRYTPVDGATIQPIQFFTRGVPLTYCNGSVLKETFFALTDTVDPPQKTELRSLLLIPETNPGVSDEWLPREGFISLHWLHDADLDSNHVSRNLKWNDHINEPALCAFLSCLLTMIQVEAIKQGAQVVEIIRAYPSAFSHKLVAKHNQEWLKLDGYMNQGARDADQKVRVQEVKVTEIEAVCRHLEWEQGASLVENTIVINLGDAISDIGICTDRKLHIRESVKMTAGFVGHYLQSEDAERFREWLTITLNQAPFYLRGLSRKTWYRTISKPSDGSLFFNNILNIIDAQGYLSVLVDQMNCKEEARKLLSYIYFHFAVLIYYAGILARKAGLSNSLGAFDVCFCGDGTLLRWVNGYERLTLDMFGAGLLGPSGHVTDDSLRVGVRISQSPKDEIGRGLLAKTELQSNPHSLTLGETGYGGIEWHQELTLDNVLRFSESMIPAMTNMLELNNFLKAFNHGAATKAAASELGIDKIDSGQFQRRLSHRLFGLGKGCLISDMLRDHQDAVLESMFIIEAKVLLETATQNVWLFE